MNGAYPKRAIVTTLLPSGLVLTFQDEATAIAFNIYFAEHGCEAGLAVPEDYDVVGANFVVTYNLEDEPRDTWQQIIGRKEELVEFAQKFLERAETRTIQDVTDNLRAEREKKEKPN